MKRTRIQNDKMFTLQDEVYSDDIIPFLKKELKRTVDLYGDVRVLGAIYAHELKIDATDVFVEKSVFIENEISISSHGKDAKAWFHSPVSAEQSILVDDKSTARIRFGKTITSKSISLRNSIVYGNLYAEQIRLVNCVVLGGVFATKTLYAENSILGNYTATDLEVKSNLGLLFPLSMSDNKPQIDGKLFMVMPVPLGEDGIPGLYKMDNDDIYPLTQDDTKKYVISNTLRLFDMNRFQANLAENTNRLFSLNRIDIHEFEKIRKEFDEYDQRYFDYIEAEFDMKFKPVYSDFMHVEDKIIEDYLSAAQFDERVDGETEASDSPEEATVAESDSEIAEEATGTDNTDATAEAGPAEEIGEPDEAEPEDELAYTAPVPGPGEVESEADSGISEEDIESIPDAEDEDYDLKQAKTAVKLVCLNCGEQAEDEDVKFCTNCGSKLTKGF